MWAHREPAAPTSTGRRTVPYLPRFGPDPKTLTMTVIALVLAGNLMLAGLFSLVAVALD